MSLNDIAAMLAGPESAQLWRQKVDEQLRTLRERIERMEAARDFLEHVVSHHDLAPDGCPHFETLIWDRYSASDG